MVETIRERKENLERLLKAAKGALQSCVEQEKEWKQKQEEAYGSLIEAVKKTEKHRRNRVEMEREVERLEQELKEVAYEEEIAGE